NRPTGSSNRAYLRTSLFTATGILADGNAAVFGDGFSNTVDADDALKMMNSGENFGLNRAGKNLAIEARPEITGTDSLFFFMTNIKQQGYQLVFAPENMDPARIAFLADNFTGLQTPLSLTDSSIIPFTVTADPLSSANNRFRILFPTLAPVPVLITRIAARRINDKSIRVEWAVENEINISGYSLEHSLNGIDYSAIATIPAIHNPAGNGLYAYTDMRAGNATNYYRVKVIEPGARELYSATVKVLPLQSIPGIMVYPNPVAGKKMSVQFSNMPAGNYTLELSNGLGQVVYRGNARISNTAEACIISLDNNIQAGNYQLRINAGDALNKVMKVVIL
ncbi:MAG TPA: T9SS type A sorting domain-containing protein, partial [Ferruginibacter sp.]|nr:T9SS type A sorting domain-containing protein [Ferruginibacter sp.]